MMVLPSTAAVAVVRESDGVFSGRALGRARFFDSVPEGGEASVDRSPPAGVLARLRRLEGIVILTNSNRDMRRKRG
jgi:hypothetical protein